MSDAHEDLRRLLRAVIILSPMEYELAGRTHKAAPFGAGQSPVWSTYSAGQPPLVIDLQTAIYDEAYCRPLGSRVDPPASSASLLEALSAADAGRDRRESGGTQQPGFYVANGEAPAPAGAESRMTRIYWHVAEAGAVPLTRAVTTRLNRYQVPFRFKTLAFSGTYTRADAAVLYFAARYYQIVARLLPAIREEVRSHLRPATPLLAWRLHDGVGLAEDPGTGESFGMSRSRLIAQAIWDAYVRGQQSEEARLAELAIQLERIGLSLDRPHLRAGSTDVYSMDLQEAAA